MNKNLCVPFIGFTTKNITQQWSNEHKAFDIARETPELSWGTWLVAMENCIVENTMGGDVLEDSGWELDRGYGILLRSITNPEVKYSYWHTLSSFPVKKGDTVLQGKPVCQMGNSGYCVSNGRVITKEEKLKGSKLGTHCHLSCTEDTIDRIDFNIKVNFDLLTTISLTLFSISNFLSLKLLKEQKHEI